MRLSFPGVGRLVSGRMDLGDITVGFNVTPAFTNKSFSLGGGVSARIPLSGRLSAEVGVSYMSLRVGTDREVDKTDTVSLQTVGIRNSVGMVATPRSEERRVGKECVSK